jgi:hypothetical protein
VLNSLERTDSLLLRSAESRTRVILHNWGSDALGNTPIPSLWELPWRTPLKWVSKIGSGVWKIHYLLRSVSAAKVIREISTRQVENSHYREFWQDTQ